MKGKMFFIEKYTLLTISETNMKRMHTKQPPSALLGSRQRSHTGSLGDVHTRSLIRSPHPSPRTPYRTARSMSICNPPVQQNPQAAKNIRKNSVISLGEHFSSLISISSQVRNLPDTERCVWFFVWQVASNIGEKVAPRRNSLTPDQVTDVLSWPK